MRQHTLKRAFNADIARRIGTSEKEANMWFFDSVHIIKLDASFKTQSITHKSKNAESVKLE